jgi:hypothetical protein
MDHLLRQAAVVHRTRRFHKQFNRTKQNANFVLDSDVWDVYGIVHTD